MLKVREKSPHCKTILISFNTQFIEHVVWVVIRNMNQIVKFGHLTLSNCIQETKQKILDSDHINYESKLIVSNTLAKNFF